MNQSTTGYQDTDLNTSKITAPPKTAALVGAGIYMDIYSDVGYDAHRDYCWFTRLRFPGLLIGPQHHAAAFAYWVSGNAVVFIKRNNGPRFMDRKKMGRSFSPKLTR